MGWPRVFTTRIVGALALGVLATLPAPAARTEEVVRVDSTLDLVPLVFVDTNGPPTGFEVGLWR